MLPTPLPGRKETEPNSSSAPSTKSSGGDLVGVILAGGRSSRMGRHKAEVSFHGIRFIDRAKTLLAQLNCQEIVTLDQETDAAGMQRFPGPARALARWMAERNEPLNLLVIPVDMPALGKEQLAHLLAQPRGGFYDDLYLPFYAPRADWRATDPAPERMRELLSRLRLEALNIPEQWKIPLSGVNTQPELAQLEAVTKSDISR